MRALPMALAIACVTDPYVSGEGEPLRVTDEDAAFHRGPLPADETRASPAIRYAVGVGVVATLGQGDLPWNGLATTDAFSIGVRFPDVGSGYWVVPVDGPDVTQGGELLFDLVIDLLPDLPYGNQSLDFVAIDGAGDGGPTYHAAMCLLPEVAAGSFWACDEATSPPSAVISLSWDTDVDLDLVVVTPDGKVVTAKSPSTAIATGPVPAEVVADPSTGTLTRDSNGDCAIDGVRLESLVFPGEPPPGAYKVYARLHQACGRPAVHYAASLLTRAPDGAADRVVERDLGHGTLIASQVARDGVLGTFVASVEIP